MSKTKGSLATHSMAAVAVAFFSTAAYAGGHLENGHWIVTSDKREAQFYACHDNAPKMDAETEACLNRGEIYTEACSARAYLYVNQEAPCLAKLKNPPFPKE